MTDWKEYKRGGIAMLEALIEAAHEMSMDTVPVKRLKNVLRDTRNDNYGER